MASVRTSERDLPVVKLAPPVSTVRVRSRRWRVARTQPRPTIRRAMGIGRRRSPNHRLCGTPARVRRRTLRCPHPMGQVRATTCRSPAASAWSGAVWSILRRAVGRRSGADVHPKVQRAPKIRSCRLTTGRCKCTATASMQPRRPALPNLHAATRTMPMPTMRCIGRGRRPTISSTMPTRSRRLPTSWNATVAATRLRTRYSRSVCVTGRLGDRANAFDVLTQLIAAYPRSNASRLAKKRLPDYSGAGD